MRLGIQPDLVKQSGPMPGPQSFSDRWLELAEDRGIELELIDVFDPGALGQIARCDGFMWRFGASKFAMARRIMAAIEAGLGIPVYPSANTWRHFGDKVGQHYLLQAAGLPSPQSWVFWREEDAVDFSRDATYPFVAKLSAGQKAKNVALMHTAAEARELIDRMFDEGVHTLHPKTSPRHGLLRRLKRDDGAPGKARESGYFLAQEFLAGNAFDTRVTVIGDRAFGYRRFNRDDDFRASGSGKADWDPSTIELDAVRLGYEVAAKLGTQSVAIDVLRKDGAPAIIEINYAFLAWLVAECPGHWRLDGNDLQWIEGQLRPEDAIFDDFVASLSPRR